MGALSFVIVGASASVAGASEADEPRDVQHDVQHDVGHDAAPRDAEPPVAASRKAVGVTVDLLPIVLSASAGEVGLSGQLWGAIDHYRLRLVGAHLAQPDWLAAKGGFEGRRTTAFALIGDYVFGEHFDGFWVGGGFEFWHESIEHVEAPGARDSWNTLMATAGGGYIWRVVGNFFVEPWAAAHLRVTPGSAHLAGEVYEPQWLSAEVSLELGFFIEL